MAIDTAAKRKSCLLLALPLGRPGVIPDGTNLDAPQRLHADLLYAGIAAGAPGGGPPLMALDRATFRGVFGRIWGRVN